MNLIIIGPQGSGKGTQAGLLAQKFNLVHIDTGLALREAAEEKTAFGRKLYKIVNEHHDLVSDEIVKKVLENEVRKVPESKGIILDGAPRRKDQIEEVVGILGKAGRKISHVVFINIPEKESIRRIASRYECSKCFSRYTVGKDVKTGKEKCPSCGGNLRKRKDDTGAGIRKRLSIFFEQTMPVVEYFRRNKSLIEVDGRKSIEEVFQSIVKKL